MRIVCFAGAATVAVSTPDSPMAKISQCVHIGCGRPQGGGHFINERNQFHTPKNHILEL